MKTAQIIKIILVVLLLLCLFKMPYGYYQFVRFMALTGFAALACFSYKANRNREMFIFIVLAVLFQPLVKIALGRMLWNAVDVIVAAGLLFSLIIKLKKR
jgi:hypothetical protein